MGMRVKFCGVTSAADARSATRLGVDYLGFNFYEGSPRYIAPTEARAIVSRLPRKTKAVGVFVDAPASYVREIARQVGLQVVQLHGGYRPQHMASLSREFAVWRVIRVRGVLRAEQVRTWRSAQALLLDSFHPKVKGGTGEKFDWKFAKNAKRHGRIILAGGLTPENVGEAIRQVHPWAVDVASGIEVRPGKKSLRKMRAFVRAVRAAKVR